MSKPMSKATSIIYILYFIGIVLWMLGNHPMAPMNYFAGIFIGAGVGFAARGVFESEENSKSRRSAGGDAG